MIPALINLVFWLLILGILVALIFWVLNEIPLPAPLNRIIYVALVVVVVLVVVVMLLQLAGGGGGMSLPKIAG